MTIFVIVGVVIILSFLPCILSNFPTAELGGAVFADVTSANVVGYQEIQGEKGTQLMQGCQFMTVGGQPVDIQNIVFKSNGEISKSNCDIWWWDPKKEGGAGYVEAKRSAFYWDYDKDERVMAICWVDKNTPTAKPVLMQKTFAPGEGFFCQPGQENPSISISGEVWGSNNASDEVRSIDFLVKGTQIMVCNPFPVDLDIQDIVFTSNGEISKSNCDIWWWDPKKEGGAGYVEAKRSAFYWDYDKDERVMAICWVDKNTPTAKPKLISKKFKAGEGFFVQPGQENPKLHFPNPFYKAAE